jgi:hypothetical protein
MVTLIVSDHVQGTPSRPSGCVSGKTVVLARFFSEGGIFHEFQTGSTCDEKVGSI